VISPLFIRHRSVMGTLTGVLFAPRWIRSDIKTAYMNALSLQCLGQACRSLVDKITCRIRFGSDVDLDLVAVNTQLNVESPQLRWMKVHSGG